MDVIAQEDLRKTEELHFAMDDMDINVFPHYLYLMRRCCVMSVIILCCNCRLAYLAFKIMQALKAILESAHASGAMQQVVFN